MPPELEFHFIDDPIEVLFNIPPLFIKSPHCPDGFIWEGQTYTVTELLESWRNYERRGRNARNMQPQHASRASRVGSLGVGRFHFRVRIADDRVFDLYYDREIKDTTDRNGHWVLYRQVLMG